MHLLFLTDNFPPEVNAPASRTFEHALEWQNMGWNVTILTTVPNFPKGKVYPNYTNKLWQTEVLKGIKVVRVWSFITSNSGFFLRTLDYISFMITSILASIFIRKIDIVIGTSPQFFTVCAAFIVSKLKRSIFVFELRDLWPESVKALNIIKDGLILKILEKIEIYLYKKADIIISVTNSFKKHLINRGIDGSKIHVITNGVNLMKFKKKSKNKNLLKKLNLENCFICGYIGTHGLAHSLETVLKAAKILTNNGLEDIKFLFLGDGAEKNKLIKYSKNQMLNNVVFIDSVSRQEVSLYWSLLDVTIIHLKNIDTFKSVIPSKMFESMAMGIPLLHGVSGESQDIVKKNKIGICFKSENEDSLINSILQIKNNKELYTFFEKNCQKSALEFDRSNLAKKMFNIINDYFKS
ncbi:glycosyltransferase family 4 protein [Alphaproteobacteria bacterium]|nr:glycosyltransferase family 4 protein [Alphaproteobacteria bacterium]